MEVRAVKEIMAVIALGPGKVGKGGAPVFFAADKEEQASLSLLLARLLGGAVHDLQNGVQIVIRH
ncbi:MAG TPA: hypothetical protein GX528_07415 [Firmicutes bacterium]|nr:hypothetical protein [Bacillota bacterium]